MLKRRVVLSPQRLAHLVRRHLVNARDRVPEDGLALLLRALTISRAIDAVSFVCVPESDPFCGFRIVSKVPLVRRVLRVYRETWLVRPFAARPERRAASARRE